MIIGSNTVVSTYKPPAPPTEVLGAKLLWLFDYNVATVVSGLITTIADVKGSGLTLSDASSARQPLAVSETINGVAQQFGRSNLSTRGLRTSTTAAGDRLVQGEADLFIVHREGSPITVGGGGSTNTGAIVSSQGINSVTQRSIGLHTVSSQTERRFVIAGVVATTFAQRCNVATSTAYTAGAWGCTRVHLASLAVELYRNGVLVGSGVADPDDLQPSQVAARVLAFGYTSGGQNNGAGSASAPLDIAYVFLTTPNLTTQELQDLSAYVNARFGVAAYV